MKDKRPRVIFIHSLNNYSGSPKVLAGVISAFSPNDFRLELYTSKGEGFLSDIVGVRTHSNGYRWTDSKWTTLFFLLISQCYCFIRVCLYSSHNTVFYINSIIPFGSILACKLTGKKMIVHIHEDMNTRKPLYKFCKKVVRSCVREAIFVSNYLCKTSEVKGICHVVYNGIELPENSSMTSKIRDESPKVLLMVASLRVEKGIYMFAEIAKAFPQYQFELVLSATQDQVYQFVQEVGEISNLRVFPLQKDMAPYYKRASLLLQLTQPSKIVETYGMTIVEAMAYGVPSVVPNVGGPKEIIEMTECGFSCETEKKEEIIHCIKQILSDLHTYTLLSERCVQQAKKFTLGQMQEKISTILHEKINR